MRGTAPCCASVCCGAGFAGKSYEYDPFNATRLINFHKLDDAVIVDALRAHRYGAVRLDNLQDDDAFSNRFDLAIAAAINQNYKPVLVHEAAILCRGEAGAPAWFGRQTAPNLI